MADKNKQKTKRSDRRRKKVRDIIIGTAERPRLSVSKTLNNVFVQIIDDGKQATIVAAASNGSDLKDSDKLNKTEMAKKVGELIASKAKEKGIEAVVFDRNQNRFHGRVKAVADGAREAGLKF